jgi:hypothetical protein
VGLSSLGNCSTVVGPSVGLIASDGAKRWRGRLLGEVGCGRTFVAGGPFDCGGTFGWVNCVRRREATARSGPALKVGGGGGRLDRSDGEL